MNIFTAISFLEMVQGLGENPAELAPEYAATYKEAQAAINDAAFRTGEYGLFWHFADAYGYGALRSALCTNEALYSLLK